MDVVAGLGLTPLPIFRSGRELPGRCQWMFLTRLRRTGNGDHPGALPGLSTLPVS